MIAYAAVALPVILAVMGIAVTLKPPNSSPAAWTWFGAFLIIGAITVVVGVKDRQNSDATLNGLKDAIDKLTKPIGAENVRPSRDPDSIYQNGAQVGQVTGARITLNQSQVYFDQIKNAGNLDRSKTFEYRDLILRLVRADSYAGMLVSPEGVATNVYQRVVCEIVGRH
jgi:hypothetical protein